MARNWIRIGHRGAPREFPANTMAGFERAVELGCEMVECDIRLSGDGVAVLAHDPEITDVEGRRIRLSEHTVADLHAVDLGNGARIPTLQELVEWAAGRCAVMADMKCESDDIEQMVALALKPLGPEAKLVPGAGMESRQRFRGADPLLPLSLSLNRSEGEALIARAGFDYLADYLDTGAVTWEYPLLTAERIAALHARSVRVFAWTVDDIETVLRLIADGVDGIISNYPDLLTAL